MSRWAVGAALTLILTLGGTPALAGTSKITTGQIMSGGQTDVTYVCTLANVGKKAVEVTMSFVALNGTVAQAVPVTANPGETAGTILSGDASTSLRCQVEGKLSTKTVALTFFLRDAATNKSLVAVTAP